MRAIKRWVKKMFVLWGLTTVLDRLLFSYNWVTRFPENFVYKLKHPNFPFPPSYYLYETYQLDLRMYREDGFNSARELVSWASPYLPKIDSVLEWGCGVARITRHLSATNSLPRKVVGVDINAAMINWNISNIGGVDFFQSSYLPPMQFESDTFDLVIGLSVFTHIECAHYEGWIQEIRRVLRPGGIFIATTHGSYFLEKLTKHELVVLNKVGCYTTSFSQKGHRMMSTYIKAKAFQKNLQPHFDVLEFHDGDLNTSKIGGQDLWILRAR